jgi:hypothetical protein
MLADRSLCRRHGRKCVTRKGGSAEMMRMPNWTMERGKGVTVRGLVLESVEGVAMTRRDQAGLVGWLCRSCMDVDLPRACFAALSRSFLFLFH